MVNMIVRLLRIVAFAVCLIVIASFVIFAAGQTKSASNHQQEEVAGAVGPEKHSHESSLHKAIDEASNELTSPFGGIVSSSSGEWTKRTVRLVLALLVYGFGVGYIARVMRVRV
jgi:hypothetical protein